MRETILKGVQCGPHKFSYEELYHIVQEIVRRELMGKYYPIAHVEKYTNMASLFKLKDGSN